MPSNMLIPLFGYVERKYRARTLLQLLEDWPSISNNDLIILSGEFTLFLKYPSNTHIVIQFNILYYIRFGEY